MKYNVNYKILGYKNIEVEASSPKEAVTKADKLLNNAVEYWEGMTTLEDVTSDVIKVDIVEE